MQQVKVAKKACYLRITNQNMPSWAYLPVVTSTHQLYVFYSKFYSLICCNDYQNTIKHSLNTFSFYSTAEPL